MIHTDECTVEKGDHGWRLVDTEGHAAAYLPAGHAANEAAAWPLLCLMARHYNQGYRHGESSGRTDLQFELHKLLGVAPAASN